MKLYNLKKFGTLLLGLLALILVFSLSKGIFGETKLRTEADVAAYADKITGFNSIKGITKSFKQVVVNDDNTPFLHSQINGRKNVWITSYKNFSLDLKATPGADQYNRNFNIYIDANDGTLLKITSKYDGFDPNMLSEPNATSAEKQLKSVGEVYLGFPKEPPKINFLDALNLARATPNGFIFQAKEIDALYVWFLDIGREPRRAWIFSLRGMPPVVYSPPFGFEKSYEQPPVWGRNHIRMILDAESGKVIFGSNVPQPEDPNRRL